MAHNDRKHPLGAAAAIVVLAVSLTTSLQAADGPRDSDGSAPAARTMPSPAPAMQAPSVVATYYFALFLAGPTGCMHFMSDGTIIGPDARFDGTYSGLPWLALFETDGEFIGLTTGLALWMIRADGIWGFGLLFNVWGVSCGVPS